ncbi:MAG: hypothetical protein U9N44_03320 [Chloroflexota bacterium]|nr:hypothetical protein [Chloroflexota bacterium]
MNKELTSVKTLYGIGIGILLAMLVGFGIAAFYENSGYYWENDYLRNVLLIAFPIGLIFTVVGLILPYRLNVLRLGLVIGGLGTMLYSIIRATTGSYGGVDLAWLFGAVAIGLVVLVPLGYYRFVMKNNRDISSEKGKNGESQ